MAELKDISRIYFLGIGGIGMSALARYFLSRNIYVSGYDKTPTVLSQKLEEEGAEIHYTDDMSLLDRNADLVVYTPAIPKDHAEYNWYLQNGYTMEKRSDVLGHITKSDFSICIAGTHGKTTISTMIAHILRDTGFGCNAFLGGVSKNYRTNYWSSDRSVSVVEADEYDRSFLKLSPDIAVISAMDADHLDIYGNVEAMRAAFVDFSGRIKNNGLLLTAYGIPGDRFPSENHLRYSLQNSAADIFASNIVMHRGGYTFDMNYSGEVIEGLELNVGGMHNVENMVAAVAVAKSLEIDVNKITAAVKNYEGVVRRFEYVIDVNSAEKQRINVVYIDDYAHHPEELCALIKSAKSLFAKRKCTIIFQPHLFSRTKDMAAEFAEVLDMADEILLLPVYPARELPVEGVTSHLILEKMKNTNASVLTKEQVLEYVGGTYKKTVEKSSYGQLLITAGAGNIDQLVKPIEKLLSE